MWPLLGVWSLGWPLSYAPGDLTFDHKRDLDLNNAGIGLARTTLYQHDWHFYQLISKLWSKHVSTYNPILTLTLNADSLVKSRAIILGKKQIIGLSFCSALSICQWFSNVSFDKVSWIVIEKLHLNENLSVKMAITLKIQYRELSALLQCTEHLKMSKY